MKFIKKLKHVYDSKYILYVIYMFSFLMIYIREFLGVDIEDAPYHIASIYQVCQGKIPLMSIWDGHTGFFIFAPFLLIFKWISPNLYGVQLYYRLISLTLFLCVSIFNIYLLGKKYKDKNVLWYMLPFVFLSPVLTLEYNTVSSILIITIATLIYTEDDDRIQKNRYFIIGILAGIMCLNYPTLTIIAIFLFFYIILQSPKRYGSLKSITYISGIALVAGLFFSWIFMNGSLDEFLVALDNVINAPHAHYRGPINADFFLQTFIISIQNFFKRPYSLLLFFYLCCLYAIRNMCPNNKKEKFALILFGFFSILSVLPNRVGHGYAILGLSIGLIALFHIVLKKSITDYFIYLVMLALFIIIYSFTSDNKNVLIGVAASASVSSFLICISLYERSKEYVKEIRCDGEKIYKRLAVLLMMVGIAHSYGYIYGDVDFNHYSLKTQITSGVFKGIFTTDERKYYLEELQSFVEENLSANDKVCVITLDPMIYCMTDAEIYTPWTFDAQYLFKGFRSDKILLDYFDQYEAYPDVLIGTNMHNDDIDGNPEYEINSFIKENYKLKEMKMIDEVKIWIWRLRDDCLYKTT